jgi:O-antigen/teichoic acid export membrane protein
MLIRQSIIYLLANGISALFGFASVFLFTRLLAPAEYGVYVVGMSVGGILSALHFTWVRMSVIRYQSEHDNADVRLTAFFAYLLSASILPVTLILLVYIANIPFPQASTAIVWALAWGFLELGQEILRARFMVMRFLQFIAVRSITAFVAGLIAIMSGGGGLGLLLSVSVAYLLTSAMFTPWIWRRPLANFDRHLLIQFATFGIPITASGVIIALHDTLDRLLVAYQLGEAAAGQYGAAADLVRQIMRFPLQSVGSAILPLAVRFLATGGEKPVRLHLEASSELLLAIVLPSAIGLAIVAPHLATIVLGPEFRDTAQNLMPVLAFAWLPLAFSHQYVHVSFHLAKKPVLLIYHGLALLGLNLILMFPLIKIFGLVGAAVALLSAESCGMVIGFLLTRSAHPMPLNGWRLLRVALAAGIMALVTFYTERMSGQENLATLFALFFVGVGSYSIGAVALNVVGCRDRLLQLFQRDGPSLSKSDNS